MRLPHGGPELGVALVSGLHDLLHPDLRLASDWYAGSCRAWGAGNGRGKVGFSKVTLPLPGSRSYCVTDSDTDHRKLSQLEAMVRFLSGEDADLECECPPAAQAPAPRHPTWDSLTLRGSGRFPKKGRASLPMGMGPGTEATPCVPSWGPQAL